MTDFRELSESDSEGWRRLGNSSERATPFQTLEWLSAWRAHSGHRGRICLLLFEEENRLVGIAPFCISYGPLKVWTLAGQGGSDYLDIVTMPGFEARIMEALSEWLEQNKRRWDWLDLQQIRPGSLLENLAGAEIQRGETCPYLSLEPDWDLQAKALGKKLRGNLGYYERQLAKNYSLRFRVATPETLDTDMSDFFRLHQKRWRGQFMPGAFASNRAREFHRTAARSFLEAGMLRLHVLELDGAVQAALYGFHKAPRTCYYLGGFEPTLAKFSLGTVLTGRAIRHAIETDGAGEFDFLRGDEPYKYKWGVQDRFNRRLSLANGPVGRLLARAGAARLDAELKAKHFMHARHGGGGKEKP